MPVEDEVLALGALLRTWRPVWSPRPFVHLRCAWEADWPEVAAWLRGLPLEAVEAWEPDPWSMTGAPPALRSWLDATAPWLDLPSLPVIPLAAPPRAELRVLERKWQQILAFGGLAAGGGGGERWVDWCGGKSHLGRTLGLTTGQPVRLLELDRVLCAEAEVLAAQAGAAVSACVLDVLDRRAADELRPSDHLVALHACGSLHHRAFALSAEIGFDATIAPCCHHRLAAGEAWRAWSTAGQRCALAPDRHELRLPSTIEIVAGRGEGLLRRRELAWRTGLDLLVREATGVDAYTPVPKIPSAWFRGSFAEFVTLMRARGLALPAQVDAERAEAAGWDRSRQDRGIGLARVAFRRALERWLILDRVAWLEERGGQVAWGTFCAETVTPRNIGVQVRWR